MTYTDIVGILKSSHFYPSPVQKAGSMEIQELHVDCPSIILMESRAQRVREVLEEAGADCRVDCMKNLGYILVRKMKPGWEKR